MTISLFDLRQKLPVSLSVSLFSSLVLFFTGKPSRRRESTLKLIYSVIIGLTLAVNDDFVTLFVVIIFHRESLRITVRARLTVRNV